MGYKAAAQVLPEDLLLAVQEYIDGEYLYIPRKEGSRRSWGDTTQTRQQTAARNWEIRRKRQEGLSPRQLAEAYYLSPKTVYKILASREAE
ncbi:MULTISPECIES: CD3324 family protein [Sporomusaceae]|uniref:CD3324 family protein n=1 Tax=Sporomusaceae TaxID=1843490 RepID=UPI0003775C02|nr:MULTISPECIES: CD3324 family protein [Sporomusaceae]